MNIWKLLVLVPVTIVVACLFPVLLTTFHVMTLTPGAWLVIAFTTAGLLLKQVVAYIASKDLKYHKQGHDFCITALVGLLTALAFQLTSPTDLFPRLADTPIFHLLLARFSPSIAMQRTMVLLVFFVFALVLALITAMISRAIEDGKARWAALLSLGNFIIGICVLNSYVFMLITRI